MTFVKHLLGLVRLPSFHARVTFGNEPILDRDRKALATRLSRAVLSQFEPVAS